MEEKDKEDFKPYGTIVFMTLLFILTGLVWFSVYYIQIDRT